MDDYYADTFEFLEGLCIYGEDEKLNVNNSQPITHSFEFISQVACEKVGINLSFLSAKQMATGIYFLDMSTNFRTLHKVHLSWYDL